MYGPTLRRKETAQRKATGTSTARGLVRAARRRAAEEGRDADAALSGTGDARGRDDDDAGGHRGHGGGDAEGDIGKVPGAAGKTIEARWQALQWVWRFAWHSDGWYGEYKRRADLAWQAGAGHCRTLWEAVGMAERLERAK